MSIIIFFPIVLSAHDAQSSALGSAQARLKLMQSTYIANPKGVVNIFTCSSSCLSANVLMPWRAPPLLCCILHFQNVRPGVRRVFTPSSFFGRKLLSIYGFTISFKISSFAVLMSLLQVYFPFMPWLRLVFTPSSLRA
jgi:hypothetical protein